MSTDEATLPRRRLVRRREGRVLAGVCTGLADFTGVDVVVFRIGFVLLTIAGASGILAYLVAAIFIPSDDGDGDVGTSPALDKMRAAADRLRRLPTWLSIVLIAVGAIALAAAIGTPHPAILWAVALILIGVLLLKEDTRPVAPPRDRPIPRAGPEGARVGAGESASAIPAQPPARAVRQRRERSPLPWLTLSLALVLTGIAILLDQADVIHLQLAQFFGIALATLGTGLLVAARWGRARSLMVIAILLLPFALAASVVKMPLRGTVGETHYTPKTLGQLRSSYHVLAGHIGLDLSRLNLSGSHDVTIDTVAGETVVYVPRNITTSVNGHVATGDISIFGHFRSGVDLNINRTRAPQNSTGKLDLHLNGTASSIKVYGTAPSQNVQADGKTGHDKKGHHAKP